MTGLLGRARRAIPAAFLGLAIAAGLVPWAAAGDAADPTLLAMNAGRPMGGEVAAADAAAAGDEAAIARGLKAYKAAGCRTCHGWAGNGVGEGPSPEAPSIRVTTLPPEVLAETVKCGRLSSAMPFFDRQAYKFDGRCYGLDQDTVGDLIPPKASKGLKDEEIADLVVYLQARVIGLDNEPNLEQCEAYWGEGHNFCRNYRETQ